MRLFDTHAHLNDPAFDPDREELMNGLADKGVGLVMNAGCSLESSRDCVKMAETYPHIYAAVGSHPDSADEVNEEVIEKYRQMAKHPKVMAIGEIGLDYYWDKDNPEQQRFWFEYQADMAREEKLPVIVHSRDAAEDTVSIAKEAGLAAYSRGMGAIGLPGDLSSSSRFVRAAFTKLNSVCDEDENSSISQFFHILNAVAQQRGFMEKLTCFFIIFVCNLLP